MLDDTTRYDANRQLAQGAPVYDVNGDKICTVADADQLNNLLVIQKGLFFPKDFPVPMSAVAHSDADGVYLNVSKDDVTSGTFAGAGTPGYASDSAADTQTPYDADAARSVGDQSLGNQAATTAPTVGDRDVNDNDQLDRNERMRADNADVANAAEGGYGASGYNTDIRRADQVNDNTPTANP